MKAMPSLGMQADDLAATLVSVGVGIHAPAIRRDDGNEQTMTGASKKPFDYLAFGLALLVSEVPEWKKMFVEPGYGLACEPEDPESIARQLR
ncbi:MAG: hypothetical protein AUI36_27970 [Cyanobacteria bacterium 13_1_40CM_2_61_4]|nr:MAG: hypothetical protein AUI36_27970 [Cyanobacteria bacterium 13_1_40CM_2_61_4]